MREIPLTQGYVALVDDADFEALNQFKWHAQVQPSGLVYAKRNIRKPNGKQTTQRMHRLLVPGVRQLDHKDGNGSNNQRLNLRSATDIQNQQGFKRKRPGASSRYRGVCFDRNRGSWSAHIQVNGRLRYLGRFKDEKEAALAYNKAAIKFFGSFATPNFL